MDQVEYAFTCPCCGEGISVLLDCSVRRQTFTEDCEVCCRPIRICYRVIDGDIVEFSAVQE